MCGIDNNHELLQGVIDAPNLGLAVYKAIRNEHGYIVDFIHELINRRTKEALGQDFTGRLLSDPGVDGIKQIELFRQVVEKQEHNNYVLEPESGVVQGWFRFSNAPLGSDRIVHIWEDITELKKAEQEVKQQNELLQATINSSTDRIHVLEAVRDENGAIVDFRWALMNNVAKEVYGDCVGHLVIERFPGMVQEGIFEVFKQVVETGVSQQCERHYKHEGMDVWVHQSVVKLKDGVVNTIKDITETKKAELEILRMKDKLALQATDKYYTIFSSIDEGFCVIELIYDEEDKPVDLLHIEANPAVEKQLGYAPAGKKASEIFGYTETTWFEPFDRIIKKGQPERFESNLGKEGKWFTIFVSPMQSTNSARAVVVFDDITVRKKAEEALRASEERKTYLLQLDDALRPLTDPMRIQEVAAQILGEFLDASRVLYYDVEPEGNSYAHIVNRDFHFMPDMTSVIGRYPLKVFGEKLFINLVRGETLAVENVNSVALLTPEEIQPYHAIDLQAFVAVPLLKDGKYASGFIVHSNIPRKWTPTEVSITEETAERTWAAVERAKAEEALRKNETLLTALLETSPIGLGLLNTEGRYLIANEELKRYLPTQIMPSVDNERFDRWIAYNPDGSRVQRQDYPGMRALRGEPVIPYLEMLYIKDDGSEAWTRVASMPLRDDKDEIIGAVTVIVDIDELKCTADALRKSEQQLKQLLNQRDEFISVAGHELKTPVTSIKAYAQIVQEMLEEKGNKSESEILDKLNFQIDRLATLINHMLDTTRVSEGQIKLTFETFNINDLLKERTEEIKRTTSHIFEIETEMLPAVVADRERIGQVITNFLSNAIKYSSDGTVITVGSKNVKNGIEIFVQDRGYGIPERDQKKVFDRFYRVKTNNMDTFPGMGLGLYISAQIVSRHKGAVSVKSKPGEGSTFSFTLPALN